MAERTDIQSMSGATFAISAERPVTFDAAGYADTGIDWTVVGQIEDHGSHGVQAEIIQFTAVDDAVVQKLKGSKNYGTKNLVVGNVESDAGQDLLATASESQNKYSGRITYALGNGESAAAKTYLDVLVASFEFQDGSVNSVRKIGVSMAICKPPVRVAAT